MESAPDDIAPAGQRAGASAYGLSTATPPGGRLGNSREHIWGVSRERAHDEVASWRDPTWSDAVARHAHARIEAAAMPGGRAEPATRRFGLVIQGHEFGQAVTSVTLDVDSSLTIETELEAAQVSAARDACGVAACFEVLGAVRADVLAADGSTILSERAPQDERAS
jgi:hypothetical protein